MSPKKAKPFKDNDLKNGSKESKEAKKKKVVGKGEGMGGTIGLEEKPVKLRTENLKKSGCPLPPCCCSPVLSCPLTPVISYQQLYHPCLAKCCRKPC